MSNDRQTRDRVRSLVREVLNSTLPAEDETGQRDSSAATASASAMPRDVKTTEQKGQKLSQFRTVAPVVSAHEEQTFAHDESAKSIITEDDVRGLERGARLRIAEGARLTPLAADIVREQNIELVRRVASHRSPKKSLMIAVAADHGGYKMKEELKTFLTEMGHRVHDYGTNSEDAVDYPDFAHAVARAVADRAADVGIVIDGAGVGSAMTANKVPGVRAAACYSVNVAKNSREHNDANVLTLGSKTIKSAEMRDIVSVWLKTEINEDRHRKRVAKIAAIEKQYSC
jgi:ribose 5-phosphate isomerase B